MATETSLKLEQIKCQSGDFCRLMDVNLSHDHFNDLSGVYVIWRKSQPIQTIYVGQGNIADRLSKHRLNEEITRYNTNNYPLLVSWAQVADRNLDGVEAYLAKICKPVVGDRHPDANLIVVNLPFNS